MVRRSRCWSANQAQDGSVTAGSQRDRRCGSSASPRVLTAGVVDCVLELGQVGVEGGEQAPEGAPADIAPAALDAGEVWGVDVRAGGQLVLREPGLCAQGAQCVSKIGVSGTCHIVKVALLSVAQNIVGARAGRTAGRRGSESANSRRRWHSTRAGWVPFSSQGSAFGASYEDRRTDVDAIAPAACIACSSRGARGPPPGPRTGCLPDIEWSLSTKCWPRRGLEPRRGRARKGRASHAE
jgi:hypothetical protein